MMATTPFTLSSLRFQALKRARRAAARDAKDGKAPTPAPAPAVDPPEKKTKGSSVQIDNRWVPKGVSVARAESATLEKKAAKKAAQKEALAKVGQYLKKAKGKATT